MKRLIGLVLLCLPLLMATPSMAATFQFDGWINYHNDVVFVNFSLLNDATNVRVWTDSYQDGANFDPITALWTAGGSLIAQNDDDASINPATQTVWDSGFYLPTLAAGNYIFSVAAFDNFANGSTLAEGFNYDGADPIPIENWWEEAPGYYHVVLDGVDSASQSNVPLPGAVWLFGPGLMGLFGLRRRIFG